jgi:hypothetical protein
MKFVFQDAIQALFRSRRSANFSIDEKILFFKTLFEALLGAGDPQIFLLTKRFYFSRRYSKPFLEPAIRKFFY